MAVAATLAAEMATKSKKFQAPKGMRDFYPADMAVRRYIENIWRQTSINHGFEEVDGPTFEDIEIYKHKSGPGIVSEIFGVYSGKDEGELSRIRSGEDAPFALRPEFTPTLARMVAAQAAQLPKPIKWFAIPSHFRAERPQRGRLREFFQWNVDFIGDESTQSDVDVIACCIGALQRFGLTPADVRVHYTDRQILQAMLERIGIPESSISDWMIWIDRYDRLSPRERIADVKAFGGTEEQARDVELLWSGHDPVIHEAAKQKAIELGKSEIVDSAAEAATETVAERLRPSQRRMREFQLGIHGSGLADWCTFDPTIVRGLAYYTGTVFEVIAEGERAVAGGGRYDKLIESFGGPSLPACGFGMGDVVLANILHDKGLLPEELVMEPVRPHAFVIAATDDAAKRLPSLVAQWRKAGLHIRHSYRTTRNVGKLLGEAGKCRARFAVILGEELVEGRVALKDLESGEQREFALDEVATALSQSTS